MLQINDKIRISKLDESNLVIEKYKIVSSEEKGTRPEWVRCGYYGSVKAALVGVLKYELFDSLEEEMTLKDLINKIDESVNLIEKIVNLKGGKLNVK